MSLARTPLTKSDFSVVIKILEDDSKDNINISENFFNLFIRSDSNELYLKHNPYPVSTLFISRIEVSATRKGTGTKILKELISISKIKEFKRIVFESCLSIESISFCKKHGFVPDPNTSFETEDGIMGNWILELN